MGPEKHLNNTSVAQVVYSKMEFFQVKVKGKGKQRGVLINADVEGITETYYHIIQLLTGFKIKQNEAHKWTWSLTLSVIILKPELVRKGDK